MEATSEQISNLQLKEQVQVQDYIIYNDKSYVHFMMDIYSEEKIYTTIEINYTDLRSVRQKEVYKVILTQFEHEGDSQRKKVVESSFSNIFGILNFISFYLFDEDLYVTMSLMEPYYFDSDRNMISRVLNAVCTNVSIQEYGKDKLRNELKRFLQILPQMKVSQIYTASSE